MSNNKLLKLEKETEIVNLADNFLLDDLLIDDALVSFPIETLSKYIPEILSLIKVFNLDKQQLNYPMDNVYRIVNMESGDKLKVAKNGYKWGVFKNADGESKMVQLVEASPVKEMPRTQIDPVMIAMSAALCSIENKLAEISERQKKIFDFLVSEKESEVKSDIATLEEYLNNYKESWDNKMTIDGYHKSVLQIKNRARKNILSYQKLIQNNISEKVFLVEQKKIKHLFTELRRQFIYYRMAIYAFSLSSLMEVMLSQNFKEKYVSSVVEDIQSLSTIYRNDFCEASIYLEKLGKISIEANIVKGIGIAEGAVGNIIGNIPFIKDGKVDEFMLEQGDELKGNSSLMKTKAVKEFAKLANPGTGIFVDQMNLINQIYNHTSRICFDDEKVYLFA